MIVTLFTGLFFIVVFLLLVLIGVMLVSYLNISNIIKDIKDNIYVLILFISIVLIFFTSTHIYRSKLLDESISIKYDNILFERNQIDIINKQLSIIVSEHSEHEENIFTNNNIDAVIAAGQLYPELKSNELYTSLMESYKQHNSNLVSGIKDYNEMVGRRRKMNLTPIIGKLIPRSDFKTITNINVE